MRFISEALSDELFHVNNPFSYRIKAPYLIEFGEFDALDSVARWLKNPWSLYLAVGANTSFRFDGEPIWFGHTVMGAILLGAWLCATRTQPNSIEEVITAFAPLWVSEEEQQYSVENTIAVIKRLPPVRRPMTKKEYAKYLASGNWAVVKLAAKRRAKWRCQVCSSKYGLEVHHNTYARLGNEEASDLLVLCRKCHRLYHDKLPKPPLETDEPAPAGF